MIGANHETIHFTLGSAILRGWRRVLKDRLTRRLKRYGILCQTSSRADGRYLYRKEVGSDTPMGNKTTPKTIKRMKHHESQMKIVCAHNWSDYRKQECGCLFRECYNCQAMEWDAVECRFEKDSMGFPIHTSLVLE